MRFNVSKKKKDKRHCSIFRLWVLLEMTDKKYLYVLNISGSLGSYLCFLPVCMAKKEVSNVSHFVSDRQKREQHRLVLLKACTDRSAFG